MPFLARQNVSVLYLCLRFAPTAWLQPTRLGYTSLPSIIKHDKSSNRDNSPTITSAELDFTNTTLDLNKSRPSKLISPVLSVSKLHNDVVNLDTCILDTKRRLLALSERDGKSSLLATNMSDVEIKFCAQLSFYIPFSCHIITN